MPQVRAKKTEDADVTGLRLVMAVRGWGNKELGEALGMGAASVKHQFANEFSSGRARHLVNELFKPQIIFRTGAKNHGRNGK